MSEPWALPPEARAKLQLWRTAEARIVFTNGVFDILHRGHVEYLEEARALGDRLVVGLNTDASVRRLKGPSRPIVGEGDRAAVVRALACVDLVVLFDEDTPLALLEAVRPHVLVKGGDYSPETIVGREFVESHGGRVCTIALREGLSSSEIVRRIREGQGA